MNHHGNVKIGMCWFDEVQWKLLKELDPEGTDDSYTEWRKQANKAFSELRASGQDIVKVSIRIEELLAWCEENDCEPVSSSRALAPRQGLRLCLTSSASHDLMRDW
jgi:hypothetical protein